MIALASAAIAYFAEIIRIKKKIQIKNKTLICDFTLLYFYCSMCKANKHVLIIVLTCNPLPTQYVISGF